MPSVISGDANVSATEFGFLDGVTSGLQSQINSKLNLAGGKILQIVRDTDTTQRTTTSASYVDLTGLSVTITPQKSDSGILLFSTFRADTPASWLAFFIITDASNNAVSGAEGCPIGSDASGVSTRMTATIWGYATPATTSATTYKMRFRSQNVGSEVNVRNDIVTGQMYAIEVSA